MARVLITGMSGAGKSTLLAEFDRRGQKTVDTDFDGWVSPEGLWDEPRMSALLSRETDLYVSGTVENQGRFYDRFDLVVLLSAPVEILIERVSTRSDNPYGSLSSEQADIRRYVRDVEPRLRAGAGIELDGRLPVGVLADMVERAVASRFSSR